MDKVKVLEKIKELTAKQVKPRPVGIDSLAMVLNTRELDLKPVLAALEQEGTIAIRVTASKSRRMARSGTVEYLGG